MSLGSVWLTAALATAGAGCNTILGNDAHDNALGVSDATTAEGAAEPIGDSAADATENRDATVRSEGGLVADGGKDSPAPDASVDVDANVDGGALPAQDAQGDATDAGAVTCVAGGACSPQGCQNGTWVCGDAGRFCETTGSIEAGTACGSAVGDAGAQVCNAAGQCVACDRGGDCSDPLTPCVRKTYDCSAGTAACTTAGYVMDGTQCGAGSYCNGGVCGACKVTAPCRPATNPCHVGEVTACTGGVPTCTDQSTAATPGVSCTASGGAAGVCDGSGTCVACTPSAACSPNGNMCQSGNQSCSAGPSCVNVTNVREGLPCAAGEICHGGACVACSAASCASGCCDATGCVTTNQSPTECGTGTGGAACTACPGPTAGTGTSTCGTNACSLACTAPTSSRCLNACVNLTNDNNNCGSCALVCPSGSSCTGSKCLCPGSQTLCSQQCVDSTTSASNCGTCGHSCGSSSTSAGQCVGSVCQPFKLASAGPLTPPLLIDTSLGSLYATLNGTNAVSIGSQTGALSQSAAFPSSGTGTVLAQDTSNLYAGVNVGGQGPPMGEIFSISKAAPMGITGLANSLSNYSTYSWLGIVPGGSTPLCALWSGRPVPTAAWDEIQCGSASTGTLTTAIDVCNYDPASSCFLCNGTAWSSTTCPPPGQPIAAAADSAGVVWADATDFYFASAANLTAVPSSFPSAANAVPGLLVLDAGHVYWYDTSGLELYSTSRSTGAITALPSPSYVPGQLAVDTTYIYWTNTAGNAIMRLTIGSTLAPVTIASGALVSGPTGIAVDSTAVYWINGGNNTVMKLAK